MNLQTVNYSTLNQSVFNDIKLKKVNLKKGLRNELIASYQRAQSIKTSHGKNIENGTIWA